MGRQSKVVDSYEKVEYWSKLFIYVGETWNNIGPVVEIIKNLNKNSIISYKYGKGQHIIRTYGTQYFHRVIGCDFKNNDDYVKNIVNGLVKFIFIFSDTSDYFTNNLISIAKKYKLILICYSNLDSIYYFYNYSLENNPTSILLKNSLDVIKSMNDLQDYVLYKEFVNVFHDFDLIPENVDNQFPVLERCLKILKESNNNEIIKKNRKKIHIIEMNENVPPVAAQSMINIAVEPKLPKEKEINKPKMLLSQFFKKK